MAVWSLACHPRCAAAFTCCGSLQPWQNVVSKKAKLPNNNGFNARKAQQHATFLGRLEHHNLVFTAVTEEAMCLRRAHYSKICCWTRVIPPLSSTLHKCWANMAVDMPASFKATHPITTCTQVFNIHTYVRTYIHTCMHAYIHTLHT